MLCIADERNTGATPGGPPTMTISHPPFDRLADLAEGLLGAADRTAVERHVSTCSRCGDDVAWLIQTIGLMRSDDTESAPEHVINRAVRLFNTHTTSEPRSAGIMERLVEHRTTHQGGQPGHWFPCSALLI